MGLHRGLADAVKMRLYRKDFESRLSPFEENYVKAEYRHIGGHDLVKRKKYLYLDHELPENDEWDLSNYMSEDRTVFDIGMGVGSDTRFYLFQGYPVVTIEANA